MASTRMSDEAWSWWRRARTAYFDHNLAQALVCIERCRALQGKHADEESTKSTCLLYGLILVELRRFPEAYTALSETLPPAAGLERITFLERSTFYEWGNFYRDQEQYEQAEKWDRKLIDADPHDTAGYIYLGSSLIHQGKFEEAQQAYAHATSLKGYPDEAFLNLGLALRAQGHFVEAAKACENALRLCPDYPEAEYALHDVQAAIRLKKKANSERLSDAAHIKVSRDEIGGMYLDNYAATSRVMTADRSRVRRAVSAREEKDVKQGDLTSGLWWDEAIEANNRHDMAQALVCIERRRAIHPDCFTLVLHGTILTDLCRFDEARATLMQALGLSKRLPEHERGSVYMAWASFHGAQGDFAQEEDWCRKRIECDAERGWSHIALGSCLSRQSRLDEAEEAFGQAASLEEGAPAFLRLGLVQRSQGRFNGAKEALQIAVEMDPDCAAAQKALDDVRAAMEIKRTLNSEILGDAK